MYPIIILDGPDGAGKSTLAECIKEVAAKHFPQGKHRTLHLTYRWKNKMPLYHRAAWNWAVKHAGAGVVILDRWHLSERVYAAAYRGGTRWPEMSSMYQSMAEGYGAFSVLCLPNDLNRYMDRMAFLCQNREEMYSEGFERLWQLYREESKWLFPPEAQTREFNYHYSMEDKPVLGGIKEMSYLGQAKLRSIAERILTLAIEKRHTALTSPLSIYPKNKVGALLTSSPKAIYIGDVHPSNEEEYPFVDTNFHHSGAAVYFHKVLSHLQLYPYEWMASNLHFGFKTETIRHRHKLNELAFARWHQFGKTPLIPVFLLGSVTRLIANVSEKYPYLRDYPVFKFVPVPHPAFLRRNGVDPKVAAETFYSLNQKD